MNYWFSAFGYNNGPFTIMKYQLPINILLWGSVRSLFGEFAAALFSLHSHFTEYTLSLTHYKVYTVGLFGTEFK